MKVDYKQNQRGGYQVYLDGKDYGLAFYFPKGYKPEDYDIQFKENERSTLLPCENLNIEFVSPPETTSLIKFDQGANINNPNNDADMDDWADAHNPNNDDYLGDDSDEYDDSDE